MTSQHEEATQQNQTNGRPEVKVTILPPACTPCTQEIVLDSIRRLRDSIAKEVKEFDQKDLPESLQTEIPKLAVLLQRIERLALRAKRGRHLSSLNSLVCALEVALTSLFQKKLSKEFTRQIRLDVQKEVIRREQPPILGLFVSQFSYVWHARSIRLSLIYGLSWSFIIMFGGLFSLALVQYAIYNSNAAVRKIDASIDTENKKLDGLKNFQPEKVPTQASTSSSGDNGLTSKREVSNSAEIRGFTEAGKLQRSKVELQEDKISDLNNRKKEIEGNRSPLDKFLSNADVGFSETLSQILWVAAAGTLGSIVSILIRVIGKSYDEEAYDDRLTPIFIGFFKPVIGASFGVLFLAFIKAQVISTPLIPLPERSSSPAVTKPFDDSEKKAPFFFFLFSVAFVVGFSERLAKETITKLEGNSGEDGKDSKENNSRVVVVRSGKFGNRNSRIQQPSDSNKADKGGGNENV